MPGSDNEASILAAILSLAILAVIQFIQIRVLTRRCREIERRFRGK